MKKRIIATTLLIVLAFMVNMIVMAGGDQSFANQITAAMTADVTEQPTEDVTEEPTPDVTEEPTPDVTEEPTPTEPTPTEPTPTEPTPTEPTPTEPTPTEPTPTEPTPTEPTPTEPTPTEPTPTEPTPTEPTPTEPTPTEPTPTEPTPTEPTPTEPTPTEPTPTEPTPTEPTPTEPTPTEPTPTEPTPTDEPETGEIHGVKLIQPEESECLAIDKTLSGPYRTSDNLFLEDGIVPVAIEIEENGNVENVFYFLAEITVENCGNVELTGVEVEDTFSNEAQPFDATGEGMVLIDPAPDAGNGMVKETLTWLVGTLDAGESTTLAIKVGSEANPSGRLEPTSGGQAIFFNGQDQSQGSATVTSDEGLEASVGAMLVQFGPQEIVCEDTDGEWEANYVRTAGPNTFPHDKCTQVQTELPLTLSDQDGTEAESDVPYCPTGNEGCAGIIITLIGDSPENSFLDATDENGNFSFTDLAPGPYTVRIDAENEPEGWECVSPVGCAFNLTLGEGEIVTGLTFIDARITDD